MSTATAERLERDAAAMSGVSPAQARSLQDRFDDAIIAIASARREGHLSEAESNILLREAVSTMVAAEFDQLIGQFTRSLPIVWNGDARIAGSVGDACAWCGTLPHHDGSNDVF